MSDQTSRPWQLILFWTLVLLFGFIFAIGAYGSDSEFAALFYFVGAVFVWGGVLWILRREVVKRDTLPFGFSKNAPLYAYSFAFMLVPLMYLVAVFVTFFMTGQLNFGQSLIPEVYPHFLHLAVVDTITQWLGGGTVGQTLQVFGWQLVDVAPGEELFKVAVINGIAVGIAWFFQSRRSVFRPGRWTMFGIMTWMNGMWTLAHGLLSYHSISDFIVAFVDGELLLSPSWYFANLIPAVLAHALWNVFGVLNFLNLLFMSVFGIIFGLLTVFLWMHRP